MHTNTNTGQSRGKIFIKKTPICNYGEEYTQVWAAAASQKKKIPAPGSVPLPTTTTADSPNSLHPSAAPPAAPLRLESHPPKCREQSPLRHVKTIFLLDWQINFLLPARELGQKPKCTVAAGVHLQGGDKKPLVCLPSLMMKEASPLMFRSPHL